MDTLLFQRFAFKKPIEIEDFKYGDEVIALSDKIIIKMDKESEEKDFAEILSKAKMGEKDPLLVTFYFQYGITEEEDKYARMFHGLCLPLLDAWTYKTMRKWAPDIYEREMLEIHKLCQGGLPKTFRDTGDMEKRRIYLSWWAILHENEKNNANIVLTTDNENREALEGYINALKELVRMEPNAALCLKLPVVAMAPYTVELLTDEKGFRYFDVRAFRYDFNN